MTTVQEEKIARRKLSLLQLAQELGNVSRACKIVGYSRQQFYEVRRNFQLYGAEGLIDQLPGPRGPHPNRVGEEVEAPVVSVDPLAVIWGLSVHSAAQSRRPKLANDASSSSASSRYCEHVSALTRMEMLR